MIFAALKLASPLLVSLAMLVGSLTSALAGDQLTMTNVTGSSADCTQPASGGVCASLFPAGTQLAPGKTVSRQVTIGYHGGRVTSEFGVYATDFQTRSARSAAFCTASDPAGKLDLVIRNGEDVLFSGTLAEFAGLHSNPQSLLTVGGGQWQKGASATFTFSVTLDISADNPYMGCVSTAGLAWYAA